MLFRSLDTYQTVEGVEEAFEEYCAKVPDEGAIVANHDDKRVKRIAKKFGKKVKWYSTDQPEARVVRNVLQIPGEHNVSNALAALHIGRTLGIHEPAILEALGRFRGAWRRFEFKGIINGAFVFSDYGHHPTEIIATLKAARGRFPFRRIWCVFQPHHYGRLASLWKEFSRAFDLADRVMLLPMYEVAGREDNVMEKTVNSIALSHTLLGRGKNSSHADSFDQAHGLLVSEIRPGDVVLMMGAGDIYKFTNDFVSNKLSTAKK